ncbi:hypothetical protein [Emticicia agri]|uniref:Lipocalin-like domain-containing protein n=1 Tax=Emticicia agri TaxID=2492393 RepID=A0A4Q5LUT4_9BACT|nr:hypothetical protein [Emticicia agri]RYU93384.1 hypothetical protein EWM59_22240 [Emticicia agri]
MTKNIRYIVALLFAGLLLGCREKYDPENPIIGTWVLDKYESIENKSLISFHRASQFEQDKPGYGFKANGLLITRQNAGWCGTPPITYNETKGSWDKANNKININGIFWGGTFNATYEIHLLNGTQLQLTEVSSKYNMDR